MQIGKSPSDNHFFQMKATHFHRPALLSYQVWVNNQHDKLLHWARATCSKDLDRSASFGAQAGKCAKSMIK